jgi:soluble lytic murein transglycosylase
MVLALTPLNAAFAVDKAPLPPRKPSISAPINAASNTAETTVPDLAPMPPNRRRLQTGQQTAPSSSASAHQQATPTRSNAPKANLRPASPARIAEIVQLSRDDNMAALKTISQTDKTLAGIIARWLYLRNDKTSASLNEILDFNKAYAGWPQDGALNKRLEQALFNERANAATVRANFSGRAPSTFEGRLAMALADGQNGQKRLSALWRLEDLSVAQENTLIQNAGNKLSASDHEARFYNRMIAGDDTGARRAARHLGSSAKTRAMAHLKALAAGINGLSNLNNQDRSHAGGLFVMAQAYRRDGKYKQAAEIMAAAPKNTAALYNADGWWRERKILVRNLLDENLFKDAYQITLDARADDASDVADILFHRGWIALRYINAPSAALEHFSQFKRNVFTPISLARADYWLGRTYQELSNTGAAQAAFQAAARYNFTYYGQLAMTELGQSRIRLKSKPGVSASDKANFDTRLDITVLKALISADALFEAGALALNIAEAEQNITLRSYIAGLMASANYHRYQVIIGKRALADNQPMEAHAYPAPSFGQTRLYEEKALIYAIARQESEFNPAAISRADARGLVQVLPETARRTAQNAGLPYNKARLLSDPAYNMQLGSYYLNTRIAQFGGSLPMAIAAYNAGENRVEEWLTRFGDPRRSKDAIDWVERIPFGETRNYVQRVLENLQVYRALLEDKPINIKRDLYGK